MTNARALWVIMGILGTGCVDGDDDTTGAVAELGQSGSDLFARATFGGNGRTCATCHGATTGTLDPAQAQARFVADPSDPLFRAIDSDGGAGLSYSRLLTTATIRVTLALPPNVRILEQPTARTVTLNRSIPTVFNTALEPVLMLDGREDDLAEQAVGAVHAHYQNLIEPTASEAIRIAQFERGLFSAPALRDFAEDNDAVPVLPPGTTDSEKRGRTFFVAGPRGLCAQCHSGPMLNTTNDLNIVQPGGSRFSTAFVSELNHTGNPVLTFVFDLPDGRTLTMASPDPGRGLVTGNPCGDVATVCNDVTALATFKIPTLWGIGKTAPYFHDNSAATFEAVLDHYEIYFTLTAILDNAPEFLLTPQDKADIVAYLRLL
jgi:cytochrome c peroxidase